MRRITVGLLMVAAMVAGACGGENGSTASSDPEPTVGQGAESAAVEPDTTTTTDAVTTTETTEPLVASAEVVVVDPGAEPQRPLRWAAVIDTGTITVQQRQETFDIALDDDWTAGGDLTVVADLEFSRRAADDGWLELTTEVVDAELGPGSELMGVMGVTTDPLIGFGAIELVDEQGIAYRQQPVGVPESNQAWFVVDTAGQWTRLVPPFPEEPVGPGAEWQVRRRAERLGVEVNEELQVTLVAASGDRLSLEVTTAWEMPGSVATDRTGSELTELDGTGLTTLVVDLTRAAPVELSVEAEYFSARSSSRTRTVTELFSVADG